MIYYLPGILAILFGLTILLFPQILVALVATFFIMFGMTIIGWGHYLRSSLRGGRGRQKTTIEIFPDE